MLKKFNLVSVSIEAAPFFKVGGLGDVATALPRAWKKAGHNPIVIIPFFKLLKQKKYNLTTVTKDIPLFVAGKKLGSYTYWTTEFMGVPFYFIDVNDLFSKLSKPYRPFTDSAYRYYYFSQAVLDLINRLNFKADFLQLHDWHTALIPGIYQQHKKHYASLGKLKFVLNIHNMAYQREELTNCDSTKPNNWNSVDDTRRKIPINPSPDFLRSLNFLKRGILQSDLVITVSRKYAAEILTKEYSEGLDKQLKQIKTKNKLIGLVNGIDQKTFNPRTDKHLITNYGLSNFKKGKKINKEFIQQKANFTIDPQIPVIGMATRLVHQKGFQLLFKTLPEILKLNLQLIVVGHGDPEIMSELKKFTKKHHNFKAFVKFNIPLASQIYAGSDFFLMPSFFEPCGLAQLIALRYGSIPIVREVGGLKDTVKQYRNPNIGNGFTFKNKSETELLKTIKHGLKIYDQKDNWNQLVPKVMRADYSWDQVILKYEKQIKKILPTSK